MISEGPQVLSNTPWWAQESVVGVLYLRCALCLWSQNVTSISVRCEAQAGLGQGRRSVRCECHCSSLSGKCCHEWVAWSFGRRPHPSIRKDVQFPSWGTTWVSVNSCSSLMSLSLEELLGWVVWVAASCRPCSGYSDRSSSWYGIAKICSGCSWHCWLPSKQSCSWNWASELM